MATNSTPPSPEKAPIRFTVDMDPDLHLQLSLAAAKYRKHKVDLVRLGILQVLRDLEDGTLVL